MKIPKKIRIGGHDIIVDYVDRIPEDKLEKRVNNNKRDIFGLAAQPYAGGFIHSASRKKRQ